MSHLLRTCSLANRVMYGCVVSVLVSFGNRGEGFWYAHIVYIIDRLVWTLPRLILPVLSLTRSIILRCHPTGNRRVIVCDLWFLLFCHACIYVLQPHIADGVLV